MELYYANKFADKFINFIINHPDNKNIPWKDLSLNPIITIDIYNKYKHLPWINKKKNRNFILKDYENIDKFFCNIKKFDNLNNDKLYIFITLLCYHKSYNDLINCIIKNNNTVINWRRYVSKNKYLTWEFLLNDFQKNPSKILLWDWEQLSKHNCITIDIYDKYKITYPYFVPLFLSSNPNFTFQYILQHPEINWDKNGLAINKNITINDYKLYPHLFDNIYFGLNPNIPLYDLNKIKNLNISTYLLALNPALKITDIVNNKYIYNNIILICKNSMYIVQNNYIKKNITFHALIILNKLNKLNRFKFNIDNNIIDIIISFI